MTDTPPDDAVRWLRPDELRAWMKLVAVIELLPAALDSQLQRDSELTHFDYMVLAMLSDAAGRRMRMTALAAATNSSLPRLSHVATRLERRGLIVRSQCSSDRRATEVQLSDEGFDLLVAAAPGHVAAAREYVIDALSAEQVAQLDAIARAMLQRLDPDCRLAALSNPQGAATEASGASR
ncbi:MarR family winged helix-turn-helix transcriptional regulator [Curtobacterium ammoniigenes]|uniref:MarR family winged helix-turn-helix transcriptional regulator n=1 Tax=Curtobacterium ammoniigenes TaxID=395387 RepID=UPI00082F80B7|nr:MarR family transcriptional regulator [Curtobacterium ammoniigenes]